MNEENKCLNCDCFSLWEHDCMNPDSGHFTEHVSMDSVCDKWRKRKLRNDYIDLVLVKQGEKEYLFEAPNFSHLEEGDTVVCDTAWGRREGVVRKVVTVLKESEECDFIKSMTGVTVPLRRIIGKLILREFDYAEE